MDVDLQVSPGGIGIQIQIQILQIETMPQIQIHSPDKTNYAFHGMAVSV